MTAVTRSRLLWVARIVLAAFFLLAAVPKLMGIALYVQQFDLIGVGQWFRYFVGVFEVIGAVGLLIRPVLWLAMAGLAVDMAAASVVNVVILHSPLVFLTVPLCVVLALLARSTSRTA